MLSFLLGGGRPDATAPPIDHAILEAAAASSLAGAFLAGYRAALASLVPALPREARTCLCASEEGGAHPRAIRSTLARRDGGGWRLDGRKKFVTGGTLADTLLVVATTGSAEGRPVLRVAHIDAARAGVTLHPMGELPFVPEIPHAEVSFDDVAVADDELLPGDGYTRYLKPFRTIEDCHVFAAVLAYLFGAATRHDWPRAERERLLAVLVTLRAIALADPSAPDTHLVLAGALDLGRRCVADARFEGDEKARWDRDAPLLMVAQRAREARAATAWEAVNARNV